MAIDPAFFPFALSTPVVFFVFNRPELTRRVFAAIREARPPRLLVVADGPRPGRSEDTELCAQVRQLILGGVDWPCDVRTDFADRNLGCGPRIFSGLQWAFGLVEEAILLEDDCLPHPTFFQYCQQMLERFRHEPKVFMVAGTNFGGARPGHADRSLLSRHCSIWGWATWRRALEGYSLDFSWWREGTGPADLRAECADWREHRFICDLFDSQKYGVVNTWDIQWFAHVFRRQGLSVVPGTNLISNLGTMGHHTNQRGQNHHLATSAAHFPLVVPNRLERDREYERVLVQHHRPPGGWILGRLANRALRGPAGPWLRRSWRTLKNLRSGPTPDGAP